MKIKIFEIMVNGSMKYDIKKSKRKIEDYWEEIIEDANNIIIEPNINETMNIQEENIDDNIEKVFQEILETNEQDNEGDVDGLSEKIYHDCVQWFLVL